MLYVFSIMCCDAYTVFYGTVSYHIALYFNIVAVLFMVCYVIFYDTVVTVV